MTSPNGNGSTGERVLVVDDEADIVALVAYHLVKAGYRVSTASTGPDALVAARQERPALIVLDLMLPGASGYDVLDQLRANAATRDIAVLMLTARREEQDRIRGLTLGADDYVTKPFALDELLARVHAVLRRSHPEVHSIVLGAIVIDFRNSRAYKGGAEFDLRPREIEILRHLAARPGKIVTREELLRLVWGYEHVPLTRTVDIAIARLRRKIEPDPHHPRFLRTAHRDGYSLTFSS